METIRVCLALVLSLYLLVPSASASSLKVGFYKRTCPEAETIVRNVVGRAVGNNPGIAAGVIRMHFHDCFVRGCDGSVLLDSTPENPLRGFEVIEEAKAVLESHCPNTVSCADVLAFAARDAAYFTGGFFYELPGGRRDGRVSLESEVQSNLPPPSFNAEQLKENFARKGLSVDEMVTLSGAHSIGVSHCSSFNSRLYGFNSTHQQDPSMDPDLAAFLKSRCPRPRANNQRDPTVPLDLATPYHLDIQYYRNLKKGRGLLTSDQTLWSSSRTAKLVAANTKNPHRWQEKYAAAMVHMGSIDVLTGRKGEIRRRCRVVNRH
ncbi:unnamed protein product [Spirodela intermedia]|uniref:Peroxidase n=1 Tax=Spirodela intermedia TaxID=51605 RepID=A0A7I8J0H2_SPIIN|nr:unnamed protein product [Spirodela intermedia]CAA6663627.1 unnamed protein product [Spirodela intermedia]